MIINKEGMERISNAFSKSAELLGKKNPSKVQVYGFTPGMGLDNSAQIMKEYSRQIRNGLFMFLVMGRFSTGKSTLINTILNENVLATKLTPATGIITQIENGEPGRVIVYYESGKKEEISENEFFDRFTLTSDDVKEVENNGCIQRFSDVLSGVLRRKCALIENSIRLVDSPGLDESISQTKMTNSFLPKANAIIFTISALDAFTAFEKEYIARNFEGRYPKNVFFVLTRADCIPTAEDFRKLQEHTRKMLEKVFKTPEGVFDELLFNNRVFYVDAYSRDYLQTKRDMV